MLLWWRRGRGEDSLGPTAARSKRRREPWGGGGRRVVGWEEERVGKHRVATSADGLRRGMVLTSRGVVRGGKVRPGCACGPTGGGVGPACVTGGVGSVRHRCGPIATPRRCGVGPIQSADRPRQPLLGEVPGEGGWRLWPAPGQGAGPDPPPQGSSREGH